MNLRPFLLLVSMILFHGTAAASTAEAESRLHSAVDEVVKTADRASNVGALAESLRPILQKYLSFDAMTRRAIGPGWRQFSKEQQDQAVQLFTTLIIRTYSSKYTPGEHAVITFKAASTPAPGRVEVPTTLLYEGIQRAVTYRLEAAEGWRITDVVAEGVSLVANYRAQFGASFQKGGATAVINSLNQAVTHPK
ncbi:MAG: ABC transporter substrate-binding protein [Terrimicrobiaceae bacterium]|nr:ABC transporter substrate-binding protein [Terrimicrobiaceae bacterium]